MILKGQDDRLKDPTINPMLVAFDLETTGSDWDHNEILQVGAVHLATGRTFNAIVRPSRSAVKHADPEATKVHGIDPSTWYDEERTRADACDVHLNEWLHDALDGNKAVAVGWGVGIFDTTFAKRTWPVCAQSLSYHNVDLNGLAYAWADVVQGNVKDVKRSMQAWHDNQRPHDAYEDAVEAARIYQEWVASMRRLYRSGMP